MKLMLLFITSVAQANTYLAKDPYNVEKFLVQFPKLAQKIMASQLSLGKFEKVVSIKVDLVQNEKV